MEDVKSKVFGFAENHPHLLMAMVVVLVIIIIVMVVRSFEWFDGSKRKRKATPAEIDSLIENINKKQQSALSGR